MTQESTAASEPEPGTGAVANALFPAGLADGRSFIGRAVEYQRLIDDVVGGRSAWFDCPARYGVNTLIEQMRKNFRYWLEPRITSFGCRLNAVHDARSFCEALLETAGQLASQTIRRPRVETGTIENLFPGVTMEIYLDVKMLPTIRFHCGPDPVATLIEVIRKLDVIAASHGCRNVFIVHDMQQILALRERDELLAALRGLIDQCKNANWLIHGHSRHAMRSLFLHKEADLYGCCGRFTLRRINSSVYGQYLADAAQSQWKCFIGRKATAMILALTDRHPYWFNALCRRLWSSDLPPVIQGVVVEWQALVEQHRHLTSREMERLSPNQRAVLRCLAETPTDKPRAKAFVDRTRVSSASVGQAIRILAELDLIWLDSDGVWTVADPVMQWSLHPRTDIVDNIYEKPPDLSW